jgi:hypothetical protein
MADEDRQQLREEIAQEKFDKSFDELDSDEVSSCWLCALSAHLAYICVNGSGKLDTAVVAARLSSKALRPNNSSRQLPAMQPENRYVAFGIHHV